MGCGLLSFGMLRWRRGGGGSAGLFSGISKYASSSSTRSNTGGYKFEAPPSNLTANGMHHNQQHYQNRRGGKGGFLIDTTLSTLLGLGISLAAIESDVFYPKLTNTRGDNTELDAIVQPPPQWISPSIPLVPGRSVISDTLCQPLTEEFRKFPKDLWQSGNRRGIENGYNNHMALYANSGWRGTKYYQANDNASVVDLGEKREDNGSLDDDDTSRENEAGVYERLVLDSLQGFVINCERRARHERKLRKIRGMRTNSRQPVVIPDDGVVADDDLELDDIYLIDDNEEDDGKGGGGIGL